MHLSNVQSFFVKWALYFSDGEVRVAHTQHKCPLFWSFVGQISHALKTSPFLIKTYLKRNFTLMNFCLPKGQSLFSALAPECRDRNVHNYSTSQCFWNSQGLLAHRSIVDPYSTIQESHRKFKDMTHHFFI